jgi:hypothetical protein
MGLAGLGINLLPCGRPVWPSSLIVCLPKEADRIVEKEQRRQARLAAFKENGGSEDNVIEIEAKEVESK